MTDEPRAAAEATGDPETPSRRLVALRHLAIALIAVLSILVGLESPMGFIGLLWCVAWWFRRPLRRALGRLPAGWGFALTAWLVGLAIEALAVWQNLPLPPEERILFHPNAAIDLFTASTFYAVIVGVWWWLLSRRDYPTAGVFWVTGAFGIIAEETGQVLLRAIADPLLGGIYLLYVAAVYGSFVGIGAMLGRDSLARIGRERPRPRWWHYLLAWLATLLAYAVYGNTLWRLWERLFGA